MGYLKYEKVKKINNDTSTAFKPGFFISFLFFVYMFMSYYEGYLDDTIGSVTRYLILFIVVVLLISYRKMEFKAYQFFMIFWLLYKFISAFWAGNEGIINIRLHFVSHLGMVMFFIAMTLVRFDKKFVDYLLFLLYAFSFSIGFLSLFMSQGYLGVEVRQTLHIFGATIDPNNQSAYCLIGVGVGIYYIITSNGPRLFHFFAVAVNIISMLLTASRGGLVSLAAVAMVFIFIPANMKLNAKETVIKFLILAVALGAFFIFAEDLLPENIYNRLFDFSSYEGGSYRADMWAEMFKLIGKNPIFGMGWGGNTIINPHNTYISMLGDIGIIGLSLFFTVVGIIIFRAFKQKNLLPVILIASGFCPAFFIESINKRFFWNVLVLAAVIINSHSELSKDNGEDITPKTNKAVSKYIK